MKSPKKQLLVTSLIICTFFCNHAFADSGNGDDKTFAVVGEAGAALWIGSVAAQEINMKKEFTKKELQQMAEEKKYAELLYQKVQKGEKLDTKMGINENRTHEHNGTIYEEMHVSDDGGHGLWTPLNKLQARAAKIRERYLAGKFFGAATTLVFGVPALANYVYEKASVSGSRSVKQAAASILGNPASNAGNEQTAAK